MIFGTTDNFDTIESYKERNLYYKIFAGYLFNELLPGIEKRKEDFFNLLISALAHKDRFRGDQKAIEDAISEARKQEVHVTFDYHSCQIIPEHKKDNRGEMSDILLLAGAHFISIECKFLANMHFGKDVNEVQERIKVVSNALSMNPLQVLLMKQGKWEGAKRSQKSTGSFYSALQNANLQTPVIVLFWEDLVSLVSENKVKQYLLKQIDRQNIKFV